VIVHYETVTRRSDGSGTSPCGGLEPRVKAAHPEPRTTWYLNEVFATLRGEPHLLWRAVDQHGTELHPLLQKRRDQAAAKRFFKRVPTSTTCLFLLDLTHALHGRDTRFPLGAHHGEND
jgi:putative transposase